MKVWMIWVRAGDYTWVEAAWTDDSTAENDEGWQEEVERVRQLVAGNYGYSTRTMAVRVPGVHEAFAIPEVDATAA